MMNERDIAAVLSEQRKSKEDAVVKYRGVIVEQTNSVGEESIHVENRPLYVWVRLWNTQGSVVPCWNDRVAAYDGATVWVAPVPGSLNELEIIGVDRETFQGEDDPNVYLINPLHAPAHEWPDGDPGLDVITTYPRSWSQLRVYPQDPLSLLVNVSPITYAYGNDMVTYGGGFIDLTAVEATLAAGEARLTLVYLDLATNTLSNTNGDIGADAGGWFLPEPDVTDATYPSAVVRIHESQTEIDESDIRDRRMFLNGSPKSGRDWPYDTEIVSVDSTDPDADHATFTAAIAAAVADNLILISPETFACNDESLPNGVHLAGFDKLLSVLSTTTEDTCLTIAGAGQGQVRDVSVIISRNNANLVTGLQINGSTSEVENVIVDATQSGAGNVRAITVNEDDVSLTDVRAKATEGAGDGYGIYVDDGHNAFLYGGRYEGNTNDLFVGASSEAYLMGPVLVNASIGGTGDAYGWYWDESGAFYTINSDIVVEDNNAAALRIIDKGGADDYLTIVSTDAQREIVINQDGADIDTRVEGSGAANALFVQGSDGFVGVGTNAPITILHAYHATANVNMRLETDRVNGTALCSYVNDAQVWRIGVDASDRFQIKDVTGGGTVVLVNPGTLDASLVIDAAEVIFNELQADLNVRMEGDTEDKLFLLDAGNDQVRLGDGDTNYFVTDKNGDTWWVGAGGLLFGSCYGVGIAWTQAAAVQNTWYDISDGDMVTGVLNTVTHDGNGQLTVAVAGMYTADWSGMFEADAANVHIEVTFSINGTEGNPGLNGYETAAANMEQACAGNAILDLAAADTVNISIRTTDAGAPDLAVDNLMFKLVQIGGT